mgnify:CR=1 FL=1
MNYHILILIVLVFYLITNSKPIIEGNINEVRSIINNSSRLSEIVQATENEIVSVLEIPNEDIDEVLKETVLRTEFKANHNNERNPLLVNTSLNYNDDILNMLQDFAEEIDQEKIDMYDGDKQSYRNQIEEKIQIDTNNYGYRYEILPKRFIDKKYRELKNDYETLLATNQCEDQIDSVRIEEQATCTVKVNEKQGVIDVKEEEIKKLGIQIARNQRIQQKLDNLKKKLKRKKPNVINRRYCNGRKKGRHPRHCGGRTVRKHECERTYKKYRGKDLQCQWVTSRRSCDFWQPGRPNTKRHC